MNNRKPLVLLFHLTLSFYPLLTLLSANRTKLSSLWDTELKALLLIFFVIFLVNLGLHYFVKNLKLSIFFYFSYIFLFFWRPFTIATGGEWASRFVFYILLYLGLMWGLKKCLKFPKCEQIIFLFLLVLGLGPLWGIGLGLWQLQTNSEKIHSPIVDIWNDPIKEKSKLPNVYIIVFDAMVNPKHFLNYFQLDNEEKSTIKEKVYALTQTGLYDFQNLVSNYPHTRYSMWSFFNLDYYGQKDFNHEDVGFKVGELPILAENIGYHRVFFELHEDTCSSSYQHCINYPRPNELSAFIFTNTPLRYLVHKLDKYLFRPLNSGLMKKAFVFLASKKIEQIRTLENYLTKSNLNGGPHFLYIHLEGMHGPNFYNQKCELENLKLFDPNMGTRVNVDVAYNSESYKQEYFCSMDHLINLAQILNKKDPNAIVLFMADHGYGREKFGREYNGKWDEERIHQTFDILAFLKTPKQCQSYFSNTHSLVNLGRGLANCMLGEKKYKDLPDVMWPLELKPFKELPLALLKDE